MSFTRSAVLFLALLSAFLALPACPGSPPVRAAGGALIDCAKHDVSVLVREGGPTLLSTTIGILQDGADGWRDSLARLGRDLSDSALACAVESARAGLSAGRHFAASEASARAAGYISERGWKFLE